MNTARQYVDENGRRLLVSEAISAPGIRRCTDCGACCFEQGSPPGLVLFIVEPAPAWVSEIPADDPDRLRAAACPDEAKEAIRLYHAGLMAGAVDGDGPCCWLHVETNRCRWYEHRPQICRDFTPGSEGCQAWRDEYNVDVEAQFA